MRIFDLNKLLINGPFALLGSKYDDTLEEMYTQVTAEDL